MQSRNRTVIEYESALLAVVAANSGELTPTELIGGLELVKLTFMEQKVAKVIRAEDQG